MVETTSAVVMTRL